MTTTARRSRWPCSADAIVKLILLADMGVETWHEASRPSPRSIQALTA